MRNVTKRQLPGKQEHQVIVILCRLKSEFYSSSLVTREMEIPRNLQAPLPAGQRSGGLAENQADRLGGFWFSGLETPHSRKGVDSAESAFSTNMSLHQKAFYQLYLEPSLGPSVEMLINLN